MKTLQEKNSKLVNQYVNGDESALAKLVELNKQNLFKFIYSKTRDKELSNDIFQDTFIKVINSLKAQKYNEEGKFLPWIMKIAHNTFMQHHRNENKLKKHISRGFDELDNIPAHENSYYKKLTHNKTKESILNKHIENLSNTQKETIKMRFYQGMGFKEIAQEENISINTALARVRYGTMHLQKKLNNDISFRKSQ